MAVQHCIEISTNMGFLAAKLYFVVEEHEKHCPCAWNESYDNIADEIFEC